MLVYFWLLGAMYEGLGFQRGNCGVSIMRSGKSFYFKHYTVISDMRCDLNGQPQKTNHCCAERIIKT